jgi:diamine N-acetyltransferase
MTTISLRPITVENWRDCIALSVAPEQERFVASNLYSLAETRFNPEKRPCAIYADETMVGFVMYGRDLDDGRYWIVRFMIDHREQGKGYGKAALRLVTERLATFTDCDAILLDYETENVAARRFYGGVGFRETGTDAAGQIIAALDVRPLRADAARAELGMEGPAVTFVEETNDDAAMYVYDRLQRYNDTQSPPMRAAHLAADAPQPLHLFLKDADGRVWGGVIGRTVWDWLEISYLWVDDRLRGQRFGTLLMERVEEAARRRGCNYVVVETFSWQARGFYERLGYRVISVLDDSPPGFADYRFRKDFA